MINWQFGTEELLDVMDILERRMHTLSNLCFILWSKKKKGGGGFLDFTPFHILTVHIVLFAEYACHVFDYRSRVSITHLCKKLGNIF